MMNEPFDFNANITYLTSLLQMEREAGYKVNGLEAIAERHARHVEVEQIWIQVKGQIQALQKRVDGLPLLPPDEQIRWAQQAREMASLALLEVDTTGVENDAEIVRVALSDVQGDVFFDQLIRPTQAHLSRDASQHNALTAADLEDAPSLEEIWPRIQRAFAGRYIISYNQDWDVKIFKAAAERHGLIPLAIIGECLQRRCMAYYQREYYLNLAKIAERMGHPLTSWDAPARLKAQAAILNGMGTGITDVSVPMPEEEVPTSSAPISSEDDLSLEDHPF